MREREREMLEREILKRDKRWKRNERWKRNKK